MTIYKLDGLVRDIVIPKMALMNTNIESSTYRHANIIVDFCLTLKGYNLKQWYFCTYLCIIILYFSELSKIIIFKCGPCYTCQWLMLCLFLILMFKYCKI